MFIVVSCSDVVAAVLLELSSELSQATMPPLDVFPDPPTNEELRVALIVVIIRE